MLIRKQKKKKMADLTSSTHNNVPIEAARCKKKKNYLLKSHRKQLLSLRSFLFYEIYIIIIWKITEFAIMPNQQQIFFKKSYKK